MLDSLKNPGTSRATYWLAFASLTAVNLLIIWWFDYLPMQDLPQHLANMRIFSDYEKSSLFQNFYNLPHNFSTYFTTYYLAAILAKFLSLMSAFKVMMSIYVILMPLGFRYLYFACWPQSHTSAWPSLFGFFFIWNATLVMGFLQYTLALPFIFFGVGAVVRLIQTQHGQKNKSVWLILFSSFAVVFSLHLFALFCLIFLIAVIICGLRSFRSYVSESIPWFPPLFVMSILCLVMLSSFIFRVNYEHIYEEMRVAFGLEFLNKLFEITWYDPLPKLNYILWNIFGPYRFHIVFANMLVVVAFIWYIRKQAHLPIVLKSHVLKWTAVIFTATCLIVPWGIGIPDELTFINFRMLPIALGLLLTWLPPEWIRTSQQKLAMFGLLAYFIVVFGGKTYAFNREAEPLDRLLAKAEPVGMMNSLVMHHTSDHFGKMFRVTHFLPMYYTVRHGGVNTQFWANYVAHLPISYKKDKRPSHTPDWLPWEFKTEHLAQSDYLIVQWATENNQKELRDASQRIKFEISGLVDLISCEGKWCLYKIKKA